MSSVVVEVNVVVGQSVSFWVHYEKVNQVEHWKDSFLSLTDMEWWRNLVGVIVWVNVHDVGVFFVVSDLA